MTQSSAPWQIATPQGETSAVWDPAEAVEGQEARPLRRTVFVCAHGAGGHMDDRSIRGLSRIFCARGLDVVRFNFFYRQRGIARPDPMPSLLSCFAAVAARTRDQLRPDVLILGGRSMGGRAASMLAAAAYPCDGLLLLAYPLHPPGQTDKLRSAHLSAITVPVLCFNGTRDSFCQRDLMEAALAKLGSNWTMRWLEDADHGFHVPKRSGTTEGAILDEVGEATARWLSQRASTSTANA